LRLLRLFAAIIETGERGGGELEKAVSPAFRAKAESAARHIDANRASGKDENKRRSRE